MMRLSAVACEGQRRPRRYAPRTGGHLLGFHVLGAQSRCVCQNPGSQAVTCVASLPSTQFVLLFLCASVPLSHNYKLLPIVQQNSWPSLSGFELRALSDAVWAPVIFGPKLASYSLQRQLSSELRSIDAFQSSDMSPGHRIVAHGACYSELWVLYFLLKCKSESHLCEVVPSWY